ncbi:hypothetical protein SSX86_008786 [Deinandra increscens subsp. villosa]|uniref:BHLH domain-containing protein n=1 Tax=Deinandra increscens subsp. villosa TaxID=3103831 RepID=A0AAP0DGK1_9ASTR
MLSRTNSVIWMDDETEHQTNHEINSIGTISAFKSMLEIEEENHNNNWFLQPHNNSSSSCSPNSAFQNLDPNQPQFFFPPKPAISSILNPISNPVSHNSLNEGFDYGVLPGFCDLGQQLQFGGSDPQFSATHLLQLGGNGFGSNGFPFTENGSKLLKPLDNFASAEAPPTLFQKRAALKRNLGDVITAAVDGGDGGGGGGGGGVGGKKRKSWEDVDDLSFDGSGLNYDSDDFTANFEEMGGGSSSFANSTVTAAVGNQRGKRKGPPAKNLMAERRRRKKLNDRLYMLRSVVPKISKMDRASILGDAIEYLKELLQKINDLNHELEATPSSSSLPPTAMARHRFLPSNTNSHQPPFKNQRRTLPHCNSQPNWPACNIRVLLPPQVEVRQREGRAVNIHMFCSRRPGLLLSTTRALEALGLDIQQAVISCFNGFALDVFRAEQCKEGQDVHPDEVKAVLLETAGYHGVA